MISHLTFLLLWTFEIKDVTKVYGDDDPFIDIIKEGYLIEMTSPLDRDSIEELYEEFRESQSILGSAKRMYLNIYESDGINQEFAFKIVAADEGDHTRIELYGGEPRD
ncbi:hypothetical protein QA612_20785 [Evansella sp. AB-P1]|uniref:hypothetical protein n=1 Tax=Evansella sp. AB-P1 TaxID=3037653 RepID=UPI00241D6201|nr:hypothetical protein [Evansella sp. AB-P1]MDG5789896.1 hypothetical protein [Evansella sp. AB-P1]